MIYSLFALTVCLVGLGFLAPFFVVSYGRQQRHVLYLPRLRPRSPSVLCLHLALLYSSAFSVLPRSQNRFQPYRMYAQNNLHAVNSFKKLGLSGHVTLRHKLLPTPCCPLLCDSLNQHADWQPAITVITYAESMTWIGLPLLLRTSRMWSASGCTGASLCFGKSMSTLPMVRQ